MSKKKKSIGNYIGIMNILMLCVCILIFCNLSKTFAANNISPSTIEVISYYSFIENGNKVNYKNIAYGFIVGSDSYIVTSFSNVKGANSVFAKIRISNDSISYLKLYPQDNLFSLYYWQDDQRNIIVFKIKDFTYTSKISINTEPLTDKSKVYYYYDSLGNKNECSISSIVNLYKISWLILNINSQSKIRNGIPFFDKNDKCIGMLIGTNSENSIAYIVTSEHIMNIIYQLYTNYGSTIFKPHINDYLISPDIFNNLSPCSEDEIELLLKVK